MESFTRRAPLLLAALGIAIVGLGCGGGAGQEGASSSGGTGGGSGATATTTATTTTSGTGGAGGGGGAAAAPHGPPATELVSAGGVVKNGTYSMVFTLGQPSVNQQKTTTKGFTMQGGLVGANGSLP